MIHTKGMVESNIIRKGKTTSVSGCRVGKLETFEWKANRMISHLETLSSKEAFLASGLQIVDG